MARTSDDRIICSGDWGSVDMARTSDDRIICSGDWGSVEYAVRLNGLMPAKKFLDRLEKKDKATSRYINVRFIRFSQKGTLTKDKFRHLRGEIFEFKGHPYRIGCFIRGNRCFLTHVFDKKSGSAYVSEQIRIAFEIMNEHLEFEKRQ